MELIITTLLVIFVSSGCATVITALTGFGGAIIFHAGWQISFLLRIVEEINLRQIVTYWVILSPFNTWPLFILSRKDVNWKLFFCIFPSSFVCTIIGVNLLVAVDGTLLKKILGICLLVFTFWKLMDELWPWITSMRLTLRSRWRHELHLVRNSRPSSITEQTSRNGNLVESLGVWSAVLCSAAAWKRVLGLSGGGNNDVEGFELLAADLSLDEREESGISVPEEARDEIVDNGKGETTSLENETNDTMAKDFENDPTTTDMAQLPSDDLLESTPSEHELSEPQSSSSVNDSQQGGKDPPLVLRWWVIALAIVCGAASGLLGGLYGISGPPLMVFVTITKLAKAPLRATVLAVFAFTQPFNVYFLLYHKGGFHIEEWPYYVVMISGGLLGMFVGNRLHHHVDTRTILRCILFLLMCSSLVLLNLPLPVMATLWCILVLFISLYLGHRFLGKRMYALAERFNFVRQRRSATSIN